MTLKIAGIKSGFQCPEIKVEPGQVVLLRGANGSGKTTLLKMIAGITPGASVALDQQSLDSLNPRERLGAGLCTATSDDPVIGPLTLQSQLRLAAWPIPKSQRDTDINTALAAWGLHPDARGEHLSGGERQRFVMARIQLLASRAVVIDEPFRHVDQQTCERIQDAITVWAAAGTAILLLVHPQTSVPGADLSHDLTR